MKYEVEIHDANPAVSGTLLTRMTVEVDEGDEPREVIRTELEIYAAGLSPGMGYEPGDRLWATWEEDEIYQDVTHVLTEDDLG